MALGGCQGKHSGARVLSFMRLWRQNAYNILENVICGQSVSPVLADS